MIMVRNYARKTTKGAGASYSKEDLQNALDDVRNGNKTIRGAAIFYHIPRSTLKHYVAGTRGKGNTSSDSKGGGGVPSYLSVEEEREIADCIKTMERNGFGLCRDEVLDLVELYIKENNLTTRFKNGRPGSDWFTAFRRRHAMSIKKPQSIEHVRCDQVNPWVIYDYFDKLSEIMNHLNLSGKPGQIFNCDETSFCHDPSKTKVVGAIGVKSQRKTSTSGRENTTVLLCCAADGNMLPMLCVFKGKYVMENWFNEEVTQTAVSATERGWMETNLFYNWFKNLFLKQIGPERPVLLIYDGHVTHVSTKLIKLANDNQVTIMKLPPHTTHVLQPLDVAVFKSLKTKWDKELSKWQRQNPRRKIPKSEFVTILTKVAQEMPTQNIISGFATTGIYDPTLQGPNKHAIQQSVFKPEDLRRYNKNLPNANIQAEQSDVDNTSSTLKESRDHCSTERSTVEYGGAAKLNLTTASNSNMAQPDLANTSITPTVVSNLSSEMRLIATTKTQNLEHDLTNVTSASEPHNMKTISRNIIDFQPSVASTSTAPPSVVINLAESNIESQETKKRKTFEQMLLDVLKKESKPQKEIKRRRITTNCEIITSTEYLQKKEQEEKVKEEALQRKKDAASRKAQKQSKKNREKISKDDDSSTESDDYSLQESDNDSKFISSEDEETEDNVSCGNVSPDVGDFYIVKVYGKTAAVFRLYVAKLIQKEKAGYVGKFFKRHGQTMKFLETDEESLIANQDFVRKLSEPIKSSSARFKDMISFNTDLSDLTNIY